MRVIAEHAPVIHRDERQPQGVIGKDRHLTETEGIGEDEEGERYGKGRIGLVADRSDQARLRNPHDSLTGLQG